MNKWEVEGDLIRGIRYHKAKKHFANFPGFLQDLSYYKNLETLLMYVRGKKSHHNIKEFIGINLETNGMFNCAQRMEKSIMVQISMMSWMQQKK